MRTKHLTVWRAVIKVTWLTKDAKDQQANVKILVSCFSQSERLFCLCEKSNWHWHLVRYGRCCLIKARRRHCEFSRRVSFLLLIPSFHQHLVMVLKSVESLSEKRATHISFSNSFMDNRISSVKMHRVGYWSLVVGLEGGASNMPMSHTLITLSLPAVHIRPVASSTYTEVTACFISWNEARDSRLK